MEFYESLEKSLESDQLDEFNRLFYARENEKQLDEFSWDVALLLLNYLEKSESYNGEKTTLLVEANSYLCSNVGNPRELYLVYLQNAQYFLKNNAQFLLFIRLIQSLLLRTSAKFINSSLSQAVDIFYKYFSSVSNVDEHSYSTSMSAYVDFLDRLIENYTTTNNNDEQLKRLFTILLVNLFDEPCLNIDTDARVNHVEATFPRERAQHVYALLNKLNRNVFKLILDLESEVNRINVCNDDSSENSNKHDINRLAVSSFVYFVYSGKLQRPSFVTYENIPLVYEKFHIFQTFLSSLNRLLNVANDNLCLRRGIELLNSLLNSLSSQLKFGDYILDDDRLIETIELLFKVSVYATSKQTRKQSTESLKALYVKFDRRGRCEFLKYFLNSRRNQTEDKSADYVISYLIYLCKEELHECFSVNEPFYLDNNGSNFGQLFNLIFNSSLLGLLPNRQLKYDLVDGSSKIIASLNLLRFVLLKDKCANATNVYGLIKRSNFVFLRELRKEIDLMKKFYSHELINIKQQDAQGKSNGHENDLIQVTTIDNKEIKEPSRNEKVASVNLALQTVDLIESIVVRCEEIIDEFKLIS